MCCLSVDACAQPSYSRARTWCRGRGGFPARQADRPALAPAVLPLRPRCVSPPSSPPFRRQTSGWGHTVAAVRGGTRPEGPQPWSLLCASTDAPLRSAPPRENPGWEAFKVAAAAATRPELKTSKQKQEIKEAEAALPPLLLSTAVNHDDTKIPARSSLNFTVERVHGSVPSKRAVLGHNFRLSK